MRPEFQIFADSLDVTERIAERLIEMTVTDEAGFRSDTLTLTIDDSDGLIEIPKKGAKLEVYLGYRPSGLARMGEYTIDEPELSGPPDRIIIRARGADLLQHLKTNKTRSWDKKTLGDIVGGIASEHGLQSKISAVLTSVIVDHIDQTAESDLHFLTRLAKLYDAIAKPAGSNLLFAPRNQSKTASGKKLPTIELKKTDVSSYSLVLPGRSKVGHVVAYWQDKSKSRRTGVTVGDKTEPGKTLQTTYSTTEEAKSAAQAELAALKRDRKELSLTLPGDSQVIAESPIALTRGWREGYAGDYVATRVEHRLGSGGFVTSISAN